MLSLRRSVLFLNRPTKASARSPWRTNAFVGSLCAFFLGATISSSQVAAQEKSSAQESQASSAVSSTAEPKHLDKLLVTSDLDEALPARPSESIYGFDLLPQETPRGIAQISSAQLANEPLRSLQDFARFSPGISPTYFLGDSLAPLIRGGVGQVYYNGLLSYEGDKHPLNFNAVETAEAVRGPASVIFGPTANTSGYLNYTLKQPRFDHDQTEISGTVGSWVSGGASYPSFTGTIDRTGPWIPGKLAYRVSYQQREGDLYYQPSHNDYQSIYAAISWTPTKDLTVDASVDWSNYDYTEHRGWNRVTQRLVDNQLYSAGPATPIFRAAGTAANQYYKVVDGAKVPYLFVNGSLVAGGAVPDVAGTSPANAATLAGWILEPQNVRLTKIYGDEGMADPSDRYKVRNLHFLSRQSLVLSPSLRLINNVIYTHYRQETFQFFGAYTAFARADTAEDRLEAVTHHDFQIAGQTLVHDSNSGVSVRYQRALGYATVTTYQENPYDLTTGVFGYKNILGLNENPGQGALGGISGVNYSAQYGQYLRFAPQFPVEGGTYSTYGGSIPGRAYQAATAQTTSGQFAFFTQHNFKLGKNWGWNVGARATALHAKISNPLIDPTNPADAVGDATTAVLPATETSLTYKPTGSITTYGTFDYAQSPVANGFTGNLNWAPGNQLGSAPLRRHSKLSEVGSKFELSPGKWFADVAAYHQTRVVGVVNGTSTIIKARGLELGTTYKPDDHWLITGNFSWLVANYQNLNLSAGAYSPAGFADDGQVVFADGNGVNKLPPGNFRLCLPQLTANASIAYIWTSGLGLQLTGSWMNHYVVSYDSNVWVPWQYELNAAVFYRQPRWEVRLDIGNVTDQRNFVPAINDNNGADAITISQPLSLQGSFRFRF